MRRIAALCLATLPILGLASPLAVGQKDAKPTPTIEEPATEVRFPIELNVVDTAGDSTQVL